MSVYGGQESNTDVSLWSWLIAPLGLMGLFFAVGHWRGLSSERCLSWRSVSVAAALLVVPLLYLNREWIVGVGLPVEPLLWLGLAALWAALMYGYAEGAGGYFFTPDAFQGLEQNGRSMLSWGFGLAGAATSLACFRKDWEPGAVRGLSWILGVVGLLGFVAAYQWLDRVHMPTEWGAEAVDGGLTALLAGAAVAFVYLARKWSALHWASAIAAAFCGIRVVLLHLTGSGAEGESFFWNALLLQFGLPFIAGFILAWERGEAFDERLRRVYQLSAMLLGFIWATVLSFLGLGLALIGIGFFYNKVVFARRERAG